MKKLLFIASSIIIFNGAFSTLAASGVSSGESTPQVAHLRQAIRLIIKDSRFQYIDVWDRVIEFFGKLIEWLGLKPRLNRSDSSALFSHPVVRWIGVILIIGLALVFLYQIFKSFRNEAQIANSDEEPAEVDLLPTQLHDLAERAAEQSNYREAIRYLYWSSLNHLKLIGIFPENLQLSDRDYLRLLYKKLGASHPVYTAFRKLMFTFQEEWYGLKECDVLIYQEVKVNLVKILEQH